LGLCSLANSNIGRFFRDYSTLFVGENCPFLPGVDNKTGNDDARLMFAAVLDRAWELQKKKYSWSERIELGAITLANPNFLFHDFNRLLNMQISGKFGGRTHCDFTRALGLAAMIIAAED